MIAITNGERGMSFISDFNNVFLFLGLRDELHVVLLFSRTSNTELLSRIGDTKSLKEIETKRVEFV